VDKIDEILARPYSRVLIPDPSGLYAAQVVEFQGCLADGETPEAAYDNLEDAARSWIAACLDAGMPIPEPMSSQGYSGTISLRLPRSLHRRAAEQAQRDGTSLNQYLVAAIAARAGAEDLLPVIASRLDSRLDKLARRNPRTARVTEMLEPRTHARRNG
jgi:predicted RNase H-like HicB family nuclease